MTHGRRDARTAIVVLVLGLALAAGCSKAPKPRAAVPAEGTRTAGRNGNGAVGGSVRRGQVATSKPAAEAGTRNGASDSGVQAGSSTSTPPVVPQLSAAEQERLEKETKAAVEQAQRGLDAVEVARLDVQQNRKYIIARDFLAQAATARTRKQYERAQGLALKARLLAEEIATR